jgi:hypothetical protein
VTFLIGNLKVLWASGDWRGLFSLRVAGAVSILLLSLLIPIVLSRRYRKLENRSTKSDANSVISG